MSFENLKQELFVLMDEQRQFIVYFASGKYKTKHLINVNDIPFDDNKALRLLTYDTEGRAKSGLKSYFVGIEELAKHYNIELSKRHDLITGGDIELYERAKSKLEVVKVELNIKEI